MKLFIFAFVLSFSSLSYASLEETYEPVCIKEAITAIAQKAKVDAKAVSFFNASLIGDGASGVEAIATQVLDEDGFWIVTMNYDDCSVLQSPVRINN